ncbi:MAG: CvpA family protein [Gammaproteobacteria bacterium]
MAMDTISIVDWIFIGIISLTAIIGLFRGLVTELISVIAWIAAFGLAYAFAKPLAEKLSDYMAGNSAIVLSLIGIFIAVLLAGLIINTIIKSTINRGFNVGDKLVGFVFGGFKGLFIVALAILLVNQTPYAENATWKNSQFVTHISPMLTHFDGMLDDLDLSAAFGKSASTSPQKEVQQMEMV